MDRLLEDDRVAITGLILAGLPGGALTPAEYRRLSECLEPLVFIATTRPVWDATGKLSFDRRRTGVTVPIADAIIAASAIHSGAKLIHADAHFDLIAEHTDLRVESLIGSVC